MYQTKIQNTKWLDIFIRYRQYNISTCFIALQLVADSLQLHAVTSVQVCDAAIAWQ
ncbi:MAG TPA: hypothetical protein PLA68_09100 [Panacibacter sp.]|nr:hypothetical protein [Panacibacter sp.]